MRLLLCSLTTVFLLSASLTSKATHIVGGEMYYEYLGSDQYRISLVVYRDCYKGIPGFDNPAYIAVFDTAWNRIQNYTVSPPLSDTIPLENYDSCTWVDTVCYEVVRYQVVMTLPPIPGGYILAYDRCCWNHSVLNIFNPDERGITVVATIPDTSLAVVNSSPVFTYRTPTFFCVNKLFEFNHVATDKDGDSLVYEIFTPYNSSRMWDSHLAPLVGPYQPLVYTAGYSLANVLGSTIPLTINAQTGFMTAHLDGQIGQFVFGVRVKEYRNGVFLGQTDRSYQINSQNCYRFTKAKFDKPISQCDDSLVIFANKSDSAQAYLWHFGDKGSNDSTSNSTEPSHLFSKTGDYTVTLIAYSYQGNSCNDTITGKVFLYPKLEGDFTWKDDECTNFVQFNDITNSPAGQVVSWNWDFGDGLGATVKDPYHGYNLSDIPKTYEVTLMIKNINGCMDTVIYPYTGVIRKYEINDVSATKTLIYPREDSTLLTVDADSAVLITWSPSEGLTDPSAASTYASPTVRTVYTVRVKDGRGCVDSKTIEIDVRKYSCGETVVYVPNAFSPNGDGENDYLRIRGEEINYLKFSVFNRWGQLVYESENPQMTRDQSLGWDGRFNGEMQDPGIYVYQLEVECSDARTFHKQGNITLIR